jgi:hypothetical protein
LDDLAIRVLTMQLALGLTQLLLFNFLQLLAPCLSLRSHMGMAEIQLPEFWINVDDLYWFYSKYM